MNKMSFIYFLLKHFIYLFFNTAPPAPPFFSWATHQGGAAAPSAPLLPAVMDICNGENTGGIE